LAAVTVACAGPVETLRESGDPAERLEAIRQLRREEEEGRLEALAGALGDEQEEVRVAAAEALGTLGKPGRERLMGALGEEPGACAAAPVLAGQAVDFPALAQAMDPTRSGRSDDSCVTQAFLGLGAAAHDVLIEALGSGNAELARRAGGLACQARPPLPEALEERLRSDEEDLDAEVIALAELLAHPPEVCGAEAEEVWRRLYRQRESRSRAAEVVEAHPRREELLRADLGRREDCAGVDALLLLVDDGHEPTPDEERVFREAVIVEPEGRCPTVDPQPLIVYLLQHGVQADSHHEARARLELLERLGWRPSTELARVHAAVIEGDFAAAAGYGRRAGPVLLDALLRYRLSRQDRRQVLEALAGLGRSFAPEVAVRLTDLRDPTTRDDLLDVLRHLHGPRSAAAVTLAIEELALAGREPELGGPVRGQKLAMWIREAGAAGRAPLAAASVGDGHPQLRAMLFGLLVEVDGHRGRATLKTARELVDEDLPDLATTAAAAHLVAAAPGGTRKRVVAALERADPSPGDIQILRVMVGQDGFKANRLVLEATKRIKAPARLLALADRLSAAGLPFPAWKCAAKAAKKLVKRYKKARRKDKEAAADEARRAKAVRDRLLLDVAEVALDPLQPEEVRLRALKAVRRAPKVVVEKGTKVTERLAEAVQAAESKKLRKGMKKALKRLKKARKRR